MDRNTTRIVTREAASFTRALWVAAAFLCFAAVSHAAEHRGCAAFSASGTLATIDIDREAHITATPAHRDSVRAAIGVDAGLTGCQAFFSPDSKLLAVGFENARHEAMELAVLDVTTMQWLHPQPMRLKLAKDSRGPLRGFLGDSNKLLVLGPGIFYEGANKTTLFPVIIDPHNGTAVTQVVPITTRSLARTDSALDLGDAVLWAPALEDNPCVLRGFRLLSETTGTVGSIALPNCLSTDLVVATSHHHLLVAARTGGAVELRLLNTMSRQQEKVWRIPNEPGGSCIVDGRYSTSPDYGAVALAVRQLRHGALGAVNSSNELLLVDSTRLLSLGSLTYPQMPQTFVMGTVDGQVKVIALDGKGWSERTPAAAKDIQ